MNAGALLNADELRQLTGTKQPKRMCAWLTAHDWAYLPPERRGEVPKVSRAYFEARMAGRSTVTAENAPQARPRVNVDFMLQPS